eukprot:COSAG02_NODE_526_length_20707_cov_11.431337_14_plen_184_part_00
MRTARIHKLLPLETHAGGPAAVMRGELSSGLSLRVSLLPRAGISLKTQILYVIVFCTRYMDLFWNFASLYNWCMKVRPSARPPARTDRSAAAADQTATMRRSCCSSRARWASCSSCCAGTCTDASSWRTTRRRTARWAAETAPALRLCVCAARTRRTTPANSGLLLSAVRRPAPPGRSGRSTG